MICAGQGIVRFLVVSDIHANLAALEAVLDDAPDFGEIWCLGDLVGYGPDPNECVERIREFPHVCLVGNHDCAVLGRLDLLNFNAAARASNLWTQLKLTPASREYLDGLSPSQEHKGFHLAHGSPREPVWEYVLDSGVARASFHHFDSDVCLVGHTHVPVIFELDERRGRCETRKPPFPGPVDLGTHRLIINPGSVGQPRDGDPRASYGILDGEDMTWELHRVAYPVEVTQDRMRAQELPGSLIDRLPVGR